MFRYQEDGFISLCCSTQKCFSRSPPKEHVLVKIMIFWM